MRKRILIVAMSFALANVIHAETPKPAAPPPAPPTLTELEQTRLENLQLKQTLIQQSPQYQALQRDLQAFRALVAADHPGYHWDDAAGLVKDTPTAAAPEKK